MILYTIYVILCNATPGLHHKIPAHKTFARVWVAQEPIFYTINAKIFQGLGPKRRESCDGDWVYSSKGGAVGGGCSGWGWCDVVKQPVIQCEPLHPVSTAPPL